MTEIIRNKIKGTTAFQWMILAIVLSYILYLLSSMVFLYMFLKGDDNELFERLFTRLGADWLQIVTFVLGWLFRGETSNKKDNEIK